MVIRRRDEQQVDRFRDLEPVPRHGDGAQGRQPASRRFGAQILERRGVGVEGVDDAGLDRARQLEREVAVPRTEVADDVPPLQAEGIDDARRLAQAVLARAAGVQPVREPARDRTAQVAGSGRPSRNPWPSRTWSSRSVASSASVSMPSATRWQSAASAK